MLLINNILRVLCDGDLHTVLVSFSHTHTPKTMLFRFQPESLVSQLSFNLLDDLFTNQLEWHFIT